MHNRFMLGAILFDWRIFIMQYVICTMVLWQVPRVARL